MTSVITLEGRRRVVATGIGRHAVSAAAAGAGLAWLGGTDTVRALALVASLAVLARAAAIDRRERRLPNRLVAWAAVPVLVAVAVAGITGGGVAGPGAGAALVGIPLLATHLVSPAGLGFGDVKAGTVLGAAAGLVAPVLGVLGLLGGVGASAAWALAGRHRSVPLGPGLVGGVAVALVTGRLVGVVPW